MSDQLGYHDIPSPPEKINASSILVRMIDGLLFRYKWATEDLHTKDLEFRPCESSMNMIELLNHIVQLANMIESSFQGLAYSRIENIPELYMLRRVTIDKLENSRKLLLAMSAEDLFQLRVQSTKYPKGYSFWHLINGPIADALTHVGQITSWRRINGNPVPKVNVFLGKGIKNKI